MSVGNCIVWAKILHVCFKDEIMKDGSDSTSECSFCHYIKIKFLLKEKIHSDIIHSFYTGNFSRLFAPQFLSNMFYNWFFFRCSFRWNFICCISVSFSLLSRFFFQKYNTSQNSFAKTYITQKKTVRTSYFSFPLKLRALSSHRCVRLQLCFQPCSYLPLLLIFYVYRSRLVIVNGVVLCELENFRQVSHKMSLSISFLISQTGRLVLLSYDVV